MQHSLSFWDINSCMFNTCVGDIMPPFLSGKKKEKRQLNHTAEKNESNITHGKSCVFKAVKYYSIVILIIAYLVLFLILAICSFELHTT